MLTLQGHKILSLLHIGQVPTAGWWRAIGDLEGVETGEGVGEESGMGPEPKHKHRVPHLCVYLGLSQRLGPGENFLRRRNVKFANALIMTT